MKAQQCSNCSAVVELEGHVFSSACPFCDSPLVDTELVAASPPDVVVSFDVDKTQAARLLRGYLEEQWLAPNALRRAAKAESVRPVFVPFFVYNAVCSSEFTCRVGIYWYRTETYTTTVNGKTVVRTRQVRETDWHPFAGTHARRWYDHLVSASAGVLESEANALEPFDLGRSQPYAYVLTGGVEAEVPTIEREAALKTAEQELQQLAYSAIASGHLPGDVQRGLETRSSVEIEAVRMALLPVWVAAFRSGEITVRLLVNGQTGEVVGDVPKDKMKVGCLFAAGFGLVALCALAVVALASLEGL